MGQEVDPIVSTLWRILYFLDEEERQMDKEIRQRRRRREKEESWPIGPAPSYDEVTSAWETTRLEPRERGRSRSRDKKGRAKSKDRAMNPATQRSQSGSPGRDGGSSSKKGRTPSPKRTPAPLPPARCPSPAPKLVSTSEVLPSDQQGWLTDQLRGRRVWCAVADMLFCVFEKEDAKVSKQVLLLPGCKVRQVEFKTASRDNSLVNGVGRRFKSKTISGVDKFQFWIENSTNRQRLMFGVDTKAELEQWMEVLTRVASVDPDTISPDEAVGRLHSNEAGDVRQTNGQENGSGARTSEHGDGSSDRESTHARVSPRSSTSSDIASNHGDDLPKGSSYTPSQTLPRRIDFLSMSLGNTGCMSKGSVDDIRKRLRKESEHPQDAKNTPLKATYADSDASSTASSADARPGRRRSFFRVGAFESLFKAKKRSASADDAMRRKSLKNPSPQNAASSPPSPEQPRRSSKIPLKRSGSEGVMPAVDAEAAAKARAYLSRSWDGEKNSRGLGASIRRSASDLKSRLFRSGNKSRDPGLRLADLTDSRLEGFLQYKVKTKWVRIWAVLCRGCFYGFKSDKKDEVPLLVFVLPQCSVEYVQQTQKRHKKLLAFKLIQPHCRSLHLCAETHQDLMKWLQALQMEVCKVVADDDNGSLDADNASNDSSNPRLSGSVHSPRTAHGSTSSAGSVGSANESNMSGVRSVQNSRIAVGSTSSDVRTRKVSNSSSGFVSSSSLTSLQNQDSLQSDQCSFIDQRSNTGLDSVLGKTYPPLGSDDISPPEGFRDPQTLRQDSLQDDDLSNLDLGSYHSDTSSFGSSISQPTTPRHDDALTQVWGRDKGYVLQLIRNKLLRRKRKAFSTIVERETIYNRELEGSHDGGLLIEYGDADQGSVDSGQEVLLGDSRQRSRSFTEGKSSKVPPHPSGIPQLHYPPRGWRSSPTTPRDTQGSDVTRRQRQHPRQREVVDPGEAELHDPPCGEFNVYSGVNENAHDDLVSSSESKSGDVERRYRYSTGGNKSGPYEYRQHSVSEPNGNHTEAHSHVSCEDTATSSTTSRFGFRYSGTAGVRDENGNGCTEHDSNETFVKGGVYLPIERGRSYSAAWDEDDDEEAASKQEDAHSNVKDSGSKTVAANSQAKAKPQHASLTHNQTPTEHGQTIPKSRPCQLPVRTSSGSKDAAQISPQTPTSPRSPPQPGSQSPHKTSHLPVPGQSSGIPHKSRDPARQLRRSPKAFDGGPPSPKDTASAQLHSPRSQSAGPPQSPRGSVSAPPQSPRGPPQSPGGHPPGPLLSPRGVSSSTTKSTKGASSFSAQTAGVPHSPRGAPSSIPQSSKTSSGIPQSPRGHGQGPPQSSRGPSVIPQSPRGPATQSPKRPVSGPSSHKHSTLPLTRQRSESSALGVEGGAEIGGKRPQPMAVMQLAARDLQSPAMHGYLHRKTFNDQWPRYWYVLQDGCLYCYLTPDDHVTVDVTDLEGYTVTSLEDKIPGQRFVIHLDHEDYIPVYLSAASREEMEEWHAALTSTMKVTPRANGLDPHEEDAGARGGRIAEERVLNIKQKLLAEVLRQKQELEKKQAARLATKKQISQDDSEIGPPPPTTQTPSGEQICTLTRLRQRRMSTQIKMDTLQRQINTNGHKKSRFTFGKKKGGDEAPPVHNPDVMEQLKMLSDHLSEIDRDLLQNGAMTLDRAHARQKLQMSGLRHSYDLESSNVPAEGGKTVPRSNGLEGVLSEESGIIRSNSLKSSMQKFAHRTFAKAGWRIKKSSQSDSVDRDDSEERSSARTSGSHDHMTSDAPDVIDLSNRLMRTWPARDSSGDSAGDEQAVGSETLTFLPPPSSFNGDEASPVSSPRSARSTGSTSGASDQGHHHSNTSRPHRNHDDQHQPLQPLKSPRRQVDPGAMANIEAFEELSRQILGEQAS